MKPPIFPKWDRDDALKATLNHHAKVLNAALDNGSQDLLSILSDFLADMRTHQEEREND